jgi:hypothetical protein
MPNPTAAPLPGVALPVMAVVVREAAAMEAFVK